MKEWGFLLQSREQNNLPIVNIKLFEGKPCLDPTEEEIPSRSDNFFPSMNRMISGGCKFDSIRKKVYDDRYQATGLKISQDTLHTLSGVKKQIMERVYGYGGMTTWFT